ncbi:bc679d9c-9bc0-40a6-86af-9820c1cef2c1 [Thermothielavioides terrestris]|uniref:Bc679d9c-9bc0-40a6-86af-9820c1cef2c1 n=1 Tax=Thermothielavioides terrestris TaxID=2587410 RepID=A0A3S4AL56_9PEZI|nr:bc679d9c-9bc0-40a6-86af-9820c1cef2c1 [Thermothielavioides terrestris]
MAVSCSCVLDKGIQSPARVGGMANLVEIFRLNIVNPVTEGLISTIGSKSVRPNDDKAPLTFGEDDDEFFALLGTDNGRGVAQMLGTYPLMFGYKVIQKVLPSPHPLSHKAARKERQQQKRADKEDRPSKG